jgi:hypothetical protein
VILTLISVGVAGCVAIAVAWTIRRDIRASIDSFTWSRSITTEVEAWVHKTSYLQPPANARNVTSSVESYTVQVPTSRTETIYAFGRTQTRWVHGRRTEWRRRTVYTFDVPHYRRGQSLTASGEGRDHVKWPAYGPRAGERETGRSQRYYVTFLSDEGKRYRKMLTHARWMALDAESTYRLRVNLFRSVRKLEPLREPRSAEL